VPFQLEISRRAARPKPHRGALDLEAFVVAVMASEQPEGDRDERHLQAGERQDRPCSQRGGAAPIAIVVAAMAARQTVRPCGPSDRLGTAIQICGG